MNVPWNKLQERLAGAHAAKRRRERLALAGVIVAGGLLAFFGLFLLDWLVRFPAWVRVGLTVVSLGVFAWGLPRRYREQLFGGPKPLLDIAREVESKADRQRGGGGFLSVLVSAVEFASRPECPGSEAMKAHVVAAAQEGGYDPRQLVLHDPVLVRRGRNLAVLAVAVYAGWAVIGPDSLKTFWLRAAGLPAAYLTRTRIEAVEIPKSVAQFKEIRVRVRAAGVLPAQGRLRVAFDGEKPFSVPLLPEDAGGWFQCSLKEPAKTLTASIRLGDAASDTYTVKVIKPAYVKTGTLEVRPPDYIGMAAQQLDLGDVEVPEQSLLNFTVKPDRPVRECWLELDDQKKAMAPAGDGFVLKDVKLAAAARYSVRLVDADGVENEDRVSYSIRVVPDQLPVVTLSRPANGSYYSTVSRVRWTLRASDDHGLKDLQLHYTVARETESGQVNRLREGDAQMPEEAARAGSLRETTLTGVLNLADLKLEAGQVLLVQARAHDKNPGRPKDKDAGLSAEVLLRIVTPEELRSIIEEDMVNLGKMLGDLTDDMTRQKDTIDKEVGNGNRR